VLREVNSIAQERTPLRFGEHPKKVERLQLHLVEEKSGKGTWAMTAQLVRRERKDLICVGVKGDRG